MDTTSRQETSPSETIKAISRGSKEQLATTTDQAEQLTQRYSPAAQSEMMIAGDEIDVYKSRCWDQAAEIFNSSLTKDSKKRVDTNTTESHPTGNIEGILEAASKAKAACDKRRSVFQQKAETILVVFHKYAACFDVMVQQSPEVTSVVWGSVRFLMGVAVREVDQCEALGTAIIDISKNIGHWGKYAQLFANHVQIQNAVTEIFAQVLNYVVRARCHFEKPWAVRFAKAALTPTKEKFDRILDSIHLRSETLEKEIIVATELNHAARHAEQQMGQQALGARQNEEIIEQRLFRAESRAFHHSLEDTFAFQREDSAVLQQRFADDLSIQTKSYSIAQQTNEELKNMKKTHWERQEALFQADLVQKILTWLQLGHRRPNPPSIREEGTCEWIFAHPAYTTWSGQNYSSPLWINGIPGCGKSVMARYLAERTTSTTITYFFQNSIDKSSSAAISLVVSILAQLLRDEKMSLNPKVRPILHDLLPQVQGYSSGHESPILQLWPTLEVLISSLPKYTLIIDALDECDDSTNEGYLLERLCALGSRKMSRVILLSRYHARFEGPLAETEKLTMDSSYLTADIMYYSERVVARETRLQRLQKEILAKIEEFSQGMFLWARLMLEDLSQARTVNEQARRLAGFPKGLDNVYTDYLARGAALMSAEEVQLRQEILTVLVGARRALTVNEVSYALALDASRQLDDNDLLLDPYHEIPRLCWPLATLDGDKVQLMHMSVKDFLLGPASVSVSAQRNAMVTMGCSNEYLALKCLSKLNQAECQSLPRIAKLMQLNVGSCQTARPTNVSCYKDTAFYEYACQNWQHHLTVVTSPKEILLQEVQQFLQSSQFVYWSEVLYHSTEDMGPIVQVRGLLHFWLELLPSTFREWFLQGTFFQAPYEAIRIVFNNIKHQGYQYLPFLCVFRLGEYSNIAGSQPGETLELYRSLFEDLNSQFGQEHLLTMKATHLLAVEIIAHGDPAAAETLLSQNKELQRKIIGESELDYLKSLECLGVAAFYLTRFHESILYQEEAHAGLLSLFGSSNREVLNSKMFWGWTLEAQRCLEEALILFENVWETWGRVMGPENPLSMAAQCAMGSVYRKQQRYGEAERHLTENFKNRQRVYTLDVEVTVDSGLQLALLHRETGNLAEAEALLDLVSRPGIVDQWFERECQVAHLRALICMDRQETAVACHVLRNILAVTASKGREANNRDLLWIRLLLADLLRQQEQTSEEEILSLFCDLVIERDGRNGPLNSVETAQRLSVTERYLRLVREAECDTAERYLTEHSLECSRPKDFWIIHGGEITDLAWINEPVKVQST